MKHRHKTFKVLTRLFLAANLAIGFISATQAQEASQTPIFVSPEWVKEHQNEVKIIDLSEKLQYRKFHLPNATWINYAWLIRPQDGLELSGGTVYMANAMSQLGIKPTDYVVIYDNMGELNSSRLYWELAKMKHPKVSLMDGGLVSWVLNQNKVTQAVPPLKKVNYPTPTSNLVDAYTANKAEVLAAIKDSKTALIDVRSKAEYIGNPKQKRSGHIPTAILFPWDVTVDANRGFRQRSKSELEKILAQVGITDKAQPIIVYCRTGHRAARVWTMLKSLDFQKVKLYDGSMQEWSLDTKLPIKQGRQP